MKIIIMGKGLVGTIVEHRLKQEGHQVTTLDSGEPNSGLYAAGFLMHHAWFKERKDSIDVAVTRYGARQLSQGFAVMPADLFNKPPTINADAWTFDTKPWDVVVWCLGAWDTKHYADMAVRAGVSFRWDVTEADKDKPKVYHSFWAPFKSNTKVQLTDDIWWAADGAALLPKNLTPLRVEQARARVGAPKHAEARIGHRPYTSQKGLRDLGGGHFAINGAGKVGCLLAVDAAEKLVTAINERQRS